MYFNIFQYISNFGAKKFVEKIAMKAVMTHLKPKNTTSLSTWKWPRSLKQVFSIRKSLKNIFWKSLIKNFSFLKKKKIVLNPSLRAHVQKAVDRKIFTALRKKQKIDPASELLFKLQKKPLLLAESNFFFTLKREKKFQFFKILSY